jgi:hypothetical protein
MTNFVTKALDAGGSIVPLLVPPNEKTRGTGLFNPCVYNDNGTLRLNLRHCQYTIYHAEKNRFEHHYGPLIYLNPENDVTLTTTNYYCELDADGMVAQYAPVDTSALDVRPIWEFVGLEDCRMVRWDNKLYLSGVRRDTTTNGQGRMELSEIVVERNTVKEVSRFRIPAPFPDTSYCEKNWMPIEDMPYHYVKWSNPTEIVRVDPVNKTCESVFMGKFVEKPWDYRGGSQVIPFGEYRICVAHIVNLFKSEQGRKNATYRHVFIVWDKDWNVVKYTEPFDFMGAEVEFCCGMTAHNDDILITFGFQDNAAYLLKVPAKFIGDYVNV